MLLKPRALDELKFRFRFPKFEGPPLFGTRLDLLGWTSGRGERSGRLTGERSGKLTGERSGRLTPDERGLTLRLLCFFGIDLLAVA